MEAEQINEDMISGNACGGRACQARAHIWAVDPSVPSVARIQQQLDDVCTQHLGVLDRRGRMPVPTCSSRSFAKQAMAFA
jgi:hypothetical protein